MANDVDMEFHDDELFDELELKKEKALAMVGMQAEGDAKIEIESDPRRVDTGRLRNSITWATTKEHSTPEPTSDNPDASDADGNNQEDSFLPVIELPLHKPLCNPVTAGVKRKKQHRKQHNAGLGEYDAPVFGPIHTDHTPYGARIA